MGQRLSGGNDALVMLADALATSAVLATVILAFGPISGGHFNPVVSLAIAWRSGLAWRDVPGYICAQVAGGIIGVVLANRMFGLPAIFVSHRVRPGFEQILGEFVATFGLLMVIWGCSYFRASWTPAAVGAYIAAAFWFTSSTSFANPAVTIARTLSDTFAGIRLHDVAGFVLAQLAGAASATLLFGWLVQGRVEYHSGPNPQPVASKVGQ